jgi:CUB/sushi domain-containing protein
VFSAQNGTIAIPPAGTASYANSVTCEYRITSGAPIYLRFDKFKTVTGVDYVYVYEGASATGTLLGKFSGATIPTIQTATSGSMFIRFNSDSSTSGNGVSLTWSDAVLTSAPSKRCILTKEMVGSYPPCSECASQAQARPQNIVLRVQVPCERLRASTVECVLQVQANGEQVKTLEPLRDWEICQLSDGQIRGAGDGYLVEDKSATGFDCRIICGNI